MAPSDRIEQIVQHILNVRFLNGAAAYKYALELYLDEQAGFGIPNSSALRLAEREAKVSPLKFSPFGP